MSESQNDKNVEISLKNVRTVPLTEREHLVTVDRFASVPPAGSGFLEFLESLPSVENRTNAAMWFRSLVERLATAVRQERTIIWAIGPHVIKYGLSPLFIDMMDRGAVTAIALNGAGAIHDSEIAMIGATSEEMTNRITDGTFGMAHETGALIHRAASRSRSERIGFGRALGSLLLEADYPHLESSLLAAAAKRGIPATIHVAFGTDIVHMHPQMDGEATGYATTRDFQVLAEVVSRLGDGGVHINIASSVVLAEVFLKCLTLANNLGAGVRDFTTANFDHLSEYRPLMNVVRRPTVGVGDGFEIIGRIELLVPLLIRCLREHL